MPELPEVESLRRILVRSAVGRTIVSARIGEARLRRRVTANFAEAVSGRRIVNLSRRAKYLIVELDGDHVMLVHLGMSGSLTHRRGDFRGEDFDPRHDHLEFALDDSTRLVFNDPRRFGLVRLVARADLGSIAELKGIGPEPLSREFNAGYLAAKARGKKVAIKNLIMDQRIVAGIGNIYAAEVLFRAGVRPTRRAGRVTRAEIDKIVAAVPLILRAAIGSRGTTFRSYRDSRGRPGRFAKRLCVYGREGEPCYTCSTPIRNVVVGQRASFYCPTCQR
ncbi:MAG TPA: bifunctional DNA-formamidopyrimidine glycosylase/DNA-(apurinic or apyrimidinic site) lyase [Candidatus Acidoferrales bacterium]|nr:bifunctional DNA-formamidopyrimidine glycosylase/DNA-(apurinic or apyrimidinic site) lyase [Candidatus Acidoferrales bacterium]